MVRHSIEPWRLALQTALHHTTTVGLQVLAQALRTADTRLIRGVTAATDQDDDGRLVGACLLAYPGWVGDGLETHDEVDQYWQALRERVAIDLEDLQPFRALVTRWDTGPEGFAAEALAEVEAELARRPGT